MWQQDIEQTSQTHRAGGVAPSSYGLALDSYIQTTKTRRERDRARMISPSTRIALHKAYNLFQAGVRRLLALSRAKIGGTRQTSPMPEPLIQGSPAE